MSSGVSKIVPIVAGAAAGYLTMNPAIGVATYGALNGDMSGSSGSGSSGSSGAQLGSQQAAPVVSSQPNQIATTPASSPFDIYGATGGPPSGNMNLGSASSQVPGGADKGIGTANSALRMYGDMTQAQQRQDVMDQNQKESDANIAASQARSAALLHPVVQAQMPGYVGMNIGSAPTMPGGFRFY